MYFIHRAYRRIRKTLLVSVANSAFAFNANLLSFFKVRPDGPMI